MRTLSVIQETLVAMEGSGLYTVALPFVLVFAIIYGLLSKLELFGDKSRQVNAVVGLSGALYAVSSPAVQGFGQQFIPLYGSVGLLLVFALTIMIALGLTNITPEQYSKTFAVMGAVLAAGVVGLIVNAGGLSVLGVSLPTAVAVPAISAATIGTVAVVGAAGAGVVYMVRGG